MQRPEIGRAARRAACMAGLAAVLIACGGDDGPAPANNNDNNDAPEARLVVSSAEIDFGNVVVDTTSTLSLGVQNSGDAAVDVSVTDLDGVKLCSDAADPAPFCLAGDLGAGEFALAAGASITLEVRFTPTAAGMPSSGSLRFACDAAGCPADVTVQGAAVAAILTCDPPSLDFGRIPLSGCRDRLVSCRNLGDDPLTVVGWSAGEGTPDDFSVEPSQVTVLVADETVDVDVTFCPTRPGLFDGKLVIETDAEATPRAEVPLTGLGGGPDLVVGSLLDFGTTAIGVWTRRTLRLHNIGGDPLRVTAINVEPEVFRLPPGSTRNPTVEGGGFFDLTVELNPIMAQAYEGTLTIVSDDIAESIKTVALRGAGVSTDPCQYAVDTRLELGAIEGGTRARRAFRIENQGAVECLIGEIRVAPGEPEAFSVVGTHRGVRIPAGGAHRVGIAYDNDRAGTETALIEISISNPARPYGQVRAVASPTDAGLLVAPNFIDFGARSFGCEAEREVRLHNFGDTPATVQSVTVTPDVFSVVPPSLPATLAPGDSVTMTVRTSAGDVTASYAGQVAVEVEQGDLRTYYVGLELAADSQPVNEEIRVQGYRGVRARRDDANAQDLLVVTDRVGTLITSQRDAVVRALADAVRAGDRWAVAGNEGDDRGRLCATPPPNPKTVLTTASLPDVATVAGELFDCLPPASDDDHQSLQSARRALYRPLRLNENAGFVRGGARLGVLFVTGSADTSPRAARAYLDALRAVKGFDRPDFLGLAAIAGPSNPGCPEVAPAPRLQAAVEAADGAFVSSCDRDWAASFASVRDALRGIRTAWTLTNPAVVGSLEVIVEGASIPATDAGGVNWTYDEASATVTFTDTPAERTPITFRYRAACR